MAFEGTWGTAYGIGQVLFKATPLLFTGLAFEVALRAGLFNIGAEGQLALASLVGAVVATKLPPSLPSIVALPIVLVVATLTGAAVAFVPAILRVRRGVHEIISAIMVNRIIDAILLWALATVLGSASLRTADIEPGASIPRLERAIPALSGSAASLAFPFAVVAVFVVMYLLRRTRVGREIRWVGLRAEACRAEGIAVERRLLFAMLLSGAIAAMVMSSTADQQRHYARRDFSLQALDNGRRRWHDAGRASAEMDMVYVPQIHSIRIENFRRIREPLTLDFTSPKDEPSKNVVFSGPNGCGKTSLLEGILLGLGQEQLIVRDLDKAQRDQHWRTELPKEARIEITVSLDGAPPLTYIRTAEKHALVDSDGAEVPVASRLRMAVEYFSSWRAPELVGPIKPLVSRGGRPQDTETNRLWRLKQRINDERAKGGYGQPTVNKADGWLEKINRAWARFHGDDGTKIDAQIVDPDADELFADLYVLQNGQRQCSIDQVSSGEIELLSFAGWIILNEFESGLVLIDEPELHLHPRWQKQILMAMHEIAPKAQFIVASHSDAIWAQAYSFERFLMIPETTPGAHNATEHAG